MRVLSNNHNNEQKKNSKSEMKRKTKNRWRCSWVHFIALNGCLWIDMYEFLQPKTLNILTWIQRVCSGARFIIFQSFSLHSFGARFFWMNNLSIFSLFSELFFTLCDAHHGKWTIWLYIPQVNQNNSPKKEWKRWSWKCSWTRAFAGICLCSLLEQFSSVGK